MAQPVVHSVVRISVGQSQESNSEHQHGEMVADLKWQCKVHLTLLIYKWQCYENNKTLKVCKPKYIMRLNLHCTPD